MLVSSARLLVGLLFFVNLTLAAKFRFSIQEIHVNLTRDISTDDLLLAIASNNGSTSNSNSWSLGEAKKDASFKWSNLTQEVEVSPKAANLSVAIGLLNKPSKDDTGNVTLNFVQSIVKVAAQVPGPQTLSMQILNVVLGVIGDLLDCTGPVALGNAVYAADTLKNLQQGQKPCETKNYLMDSTKHSCSLTLTPSNYTITYCLERLTVDKDEIKTSATAGLFPALGLSVLGLAVAIFF